MKRIFLLLMMLLYASVAVADDDLLSGDTRLACEALLCLSSGQRPSECNPALNRYFSIHHKKWSDTVSARRNFLRMCPTASADANMTSLVESIVNAAGRCTAAELNQWNRTWMTKRICEDAYDDDTGRKYLRCYDKPVLVISTNLPQYCRAYQSHGYTYQVGVHYVGDPLEGGHWVDDYTE